MSYRNPQIIVDKTAEVWAQTSSNLGKIMAKGVEDIYKAQEVEAARIKKEQEGYQLVENNVMLNYNEQQQKAAAGIKDKGLSGQFVNMYEGMLEGKDGAIAAKTALKINGASLPKEERQRLLKIVNDAESFKNVMVNSAGVVIADVEENGKLKPGDFGNGYNWKGQGDGEKFGNMLAYQAIADKTITGITQEKSLDRLDDGTVMMKVNSTVDTNSEFVKRMIEKELFSLDDLEVDDKGFAKLPTWEMDIAKYGDGMIIKTPENIDQAKSLEQAGFVKNGIANEETVGASNTTVEIGKGSKNQSTVSYFDPSIMRRSKTLQAEYKSFATGNILGRSLDEQLNYLEDTLKVKIKPEEWTKKTPEEQTEIITDRLMKQGIETVQGSGFKPSKATKDDVRILGEQGIKIEEGADIYTRIDKSKNTYTSEDKNSKTGKGGNEEGGPRNSTILKNISSLIDTGVLNGKRYYDFTFQGTDDVNTQKYRIEPIPGDSEHVMVTQAHSNGSWKGVEPEKYPVTTLQKELGSSKKSSAKELTLEELKAKYTKQQ